MFQLYMPMYAKHATATHLCKVRSLNLNYLSSPITVCGNEYIQSILTLGTAHP